MQTLTESITSHLSTTEQNPQSSGGSNSLALTSDTEGKKALALELYQRFHAMKTWGKSPESLESIISIFSRDLANYPAAHIMKAISIHSRQSQDFPTVSDIAGIIKRKGKAPLNKETYISISKKNAEDRTSDDWKYLREYQEEQQQSEWGSDETDSVKQQNFIKDNQKLRTENAELKKENKCLAEMLHNERTQRAKTVKAAEIPQSKLDKTIAYMRATGASETDIAHFKSVEAA